MIDGKRLTLYAHRLAYEAANGPIPEGFDVRHSCDNPPCSNPRHLSLGTRRENMQDAKDRGRLLGRSSPTSSPHPTNPASRRRCNR